MKKILALVVAVMMLMTCASALAEGHEIVVVPKDASNPWFVRMNTGVEEYAAAHGISLRGRFAWPQCLRLVYFQPPRHPGTEDEQIMAASIDAIIWLSKHMKEIGIGIRKIGSNSQWITLLRKEADGYVAGDMAMPKLPETVIPEGESLNDIYQMKTRKMKKHGTWFCQLVIQSEPRHADGVEGLHYPWELFTFDLDRKQQVAVQARTVPAQR